MCMNMYAYINNTHINQLLVLTLVPVFGVFFAKPALLSTL
jgi:hypothetical protein